MWKKVSRTTPNFMGQMPWEGSLPINIRRIEMYESNPKFLSSLRIFSEFCILKMFDKFWDVWALWLINPMFKCKIKYFRLQQNDILNQVHTYGKSLNKLVVWPKVLKGMEAYFISRNTKYAIDYLIREKKTGIKVTWLNC